MLQTIYFVQRSGILFQFYHKIETLSFESLVTRPKEKNNNTNSGNINII